MKKLHALLLMTVVSTVLSGCASGPLYREVKASGAIKQPADKALVLVYSHTLPRAGAGLGFGLDKNGHKFRVYAKENEGAENEVCSMMGTDYFFYFYPNPGQLHMGCGMRHPFLSGGGLIGAGFFHKSEKVAFPVVAGETYYVDIHNGMSGVKMIEVPKEKGEKEIESCHLVDAATEQK